MKVESREDLVYLMRVLVHNRQYPSGDWDQTVEQVRPHDRRTRDIYRDYMNAARHQDGKKGTA